MRIGICALNMQSAASHAKAGISRYCSGLLDGLRELPESHEYYIFTSPGYEPQPELVNDSRFHFPTPSGPFLKNKFLREFLVGPSWIGEHRLDRYISTAHGLPWRRKCKAAVVVHDLFPATHPEFFSRRDALVLPRANSWSMKVSQVIIANSEFTKSEIVRVGGTSPDKIVVIPLSIGNLLPPVDPESVSDERLVTIGVPIKDFFFTIGTLEPRKNLPRLIEAFAPIAKDHPKLGLVIAGARGWKEHAIATTVEKLKLQNQVIFLGYVDDQDLPALFARSRAFVCASTIEGFGIPVLEAQHFGAPVITSTGGSLPEVANPEAIFFDPHSITSIETALRNQLASDKDRNEVTSAGKEFAAKFSWRRTARETLDSLINL